MEINCPEYQRRKKDSRTGKLTDDDYLVLRKMNHGTGPHVDDPNWHLTHNALSKKVKTKEVVE
jgi:hypothetical protein